MRGTMLCLALLIVSAGCAAFRHLPGLPASLLTEQEWSSALTIGRTTKPEVLSVLGVPFTQSEDGRTATYRLDDYNRLLSVTRELDSSDSAEAYLRFLAAQVFARHSLVLVFNEHESLERYFTRLIPRAKEEWPLLLTVGKATKEELMSILGPPSAQFEAGRILTYRLTDEYRFVISNNKENRNTLPEEKGFRYSLVLVFDSSETLRKHRFVDLSTWESIP